ncbi:uroporphyrinogen-III synthase [Microbacterium saperdae]|uniref:Uroporphyrinogen-III synthase n=1 Tax=Microbacterium saperdae TaxID=69368 RepID=A0A543BMK9_9MICO|nr:uroporphyrinogen-III synthase [Microbacterium saperdae]TQL86079.1 uroporphyrinogen-III synthase [Microbacterium saperdae]GGM50779.1 uroporphyrinogen-III synthase [Microbacterium saperdae]
MTRSATQPPLRVESALAGCSIVVAADRRSIDSAAVLERQGATVLASPPLGVAPRADATEVRTTIAALIAAQPEFVVVTTWAEYWNWWDDAYAGGRGEELDHALRDAQVVIRGSAMSVESPGHQSSVLRPAEEVAAHALVSAMAGRRVAVQRQRPVSDGLEAILIEAGAAVVGVPARGWGPPPDPARVRRSTVQAAAGEVDAVLFASAAGSAAWLAVAESEGALDAVRRRASNGRLLLATPTPIVAGPLRAARIPSVVAECGNRAALACAVIAHFGEGGAPSLRTDAGRMEVRSGGAVIDERFIPLPRTSASLLDALFLAEGRVLSRAEIARSLPGAPRSGHAVEAAVARLRDALPVSGVVQTVVKRGYRLAVADL